MHAAVIVEPGRVAVEEIAEPVAGPGEAKVAVDLVGVCATDVHMLHGTFPAAVYPVLLGHEVTGLVAEVGPGVETLAVGDRVVLDPGVPCGSCTSCHDGRPNLCGERGAFGVNLPGGAAEFMVAPVANLYRVGATVPAAAAVLAEPLACVVHALDLVRPAAGRDVLVYGAGTVGLLAVSVLRTLGARSITVVDRVEGRLDRARSAGADHIGSTPATAPLDEWDLVIDATGSVSAIEDGLGRIARGGTFLQIGVAPPGAGVTLSPYVLFQREITVQGSMTTRHTFPRAITLLEAGAVDPSLFSAGAYGLDEYTEAIDRSGSGDVPKVVVQPARELVRDEDLTR